jgi:hypothetical protein
MGPIFGTWPKSSEPGPHADPRPFKRHPSPSSYPRFFTASDSRNRLTATDDIWPLRPRRRLHRQWRGRVAKQDHHRIATAAEIRDLLRVAAGRGTDPMMIRLVTEMLIDHLLASGFALVKLDPSDIPPAD